MVMVEVYLGLRTAPLHLIIQVCLLYHRVFIGIFMREVYIGLRPAKFLHITMVVYALPTQGFVKKLFQGGWKDKIHIKIILIITIQ